MSIAVCNCVCQEGKLKKGKFVGFCLRRRNRALFVCANLRLKRLRPFSFACTRDYSLLVGKKVYKRPKSSIFVYVTPSKTWKIQASLDFSRLRDTFN